MPRRDTGCEHLGSRAWTGHAVVDRVDSYTDIRYRATVTSHVTPRVMRRFGRVVDVAGDDEKVWLVDHDARVVQVGSADGGAVALQMPAIEFIVPVMFRPLQSVEIDLPERMSLAGAADVGGVECDVVYLDFPDDSGYGEQYFYVGRRDHLPRRIVLVGTDPAPGSAVSTRGCRWSSTGSTPESRATRWPSWRRSMSPSPSSWRATSSPNATE